VGSTGRRATLLSYSLDPLHGAGVELRLRPLLLPPACPRRACSIGIGLFYVAFLPRFSWPLLIPSFFALRFLDSLSLNVSFLIRRPVGKFAQKREGLKPETTSKSGLLYVLY